MVTHLSTGVTMTESASLVTTEWTALVWVRAIRQLQVPWSPAPTTSSRSQLRPGSGPGSILTRGFVTEQSSSGFPFSMSGWTWLCFGILKSLLGNQEYIHCNFVSFPPCLNSASSPAQGWLPHTEKPGAGGGAPEPHPGPGLDAVNQAEAGAGQLSVKK